MTTTVYETVTAEELLEMGDIGRCELIEGRIVRMSPSGLEQGKVIVKITRLLGDFIEQRRLGIAMGAETGFRLGRNPDTVRVPDFGFIRAGRIPTGTTVSGYFEGAPDLAVEVLSPGDRQSEVLAKVDQWLASGAVSVWVVDPRTRSVMIHRSDGQVVRLRETEQITGEPALPGFKCAVANLFPAPI
jgi:Uma2 family endonuclease